MFCSRTDPVLCSRTDPVLCSRTNSVLCSRTNRVLCSRTDPVLRSLLQIHGATVDNANVLLQIDNSKLAADDFRTK